MTNIYLIHDPISGLYKIGRSVGVLQRERTLLAQAPQIYLVCHWTESYPEVESILHEKFKPLRRRGEWFALSSQDVLNVYGWLSPLFRRVDSVRPSQDALTACVEGDFRLSALNAYKKRHGHPDTLEKL